jgi:hypothetical protein
LLPLPLLSHLLLLLLLLQVPLELYKSSMRGVRKYLVRHVWDGHADASVVSEARLDQNSGVIYDTNNRFEHLTCFAGGMFVLGGYARAYGRDHIRAWLHMLRARVRQRCSCCRSRKKPQVCTAMDATSQFATPVQPFLVTARL